MHIFSVLIFIAVSNASSSSLHLKHGAIRSKYVSLGVERQLFKMKNAWCGSINSRFSVMSSITLYFAFSLNLSVDGQIPHATGILVTANGWGQV